MEHVTELAAHLTTRHLARVVVRYAVTDSTSERAMASAKAGASHGLTVVADAQTAGRGQRGRTWRSEPGAGLYASFVLRLDWPATKMAMVTLATGVAVRQAIQPLTSVPLGLKWPNDVLIAEPGPRYGRKLAGILFEVVSDHDAVNHAVLGIGINLRPPTDPALADFATGLRALAPTASAHPDAPGLLAHLANALELQLDRLGAGETEAVCADWTAAALGLGQRVEVQHPGHRDTGELVGIDDRGGLVLRTSGGTRTLLTGSLVLPGAPRPPR